MFFILSVKNPLMLAKFYGKYQKEVYNIINLHKSDQTELKELTEAQRIFSQFLYQLSLC